MQEDTVDQAFALLGVSDRTDPEAVLEVEMRALAILQVALKVLDVRAGRKRAVELVVEAFGLISAPDREKTVLAIAATPAEQLADTLLGYLRQRDAANPAEAAAGHDDAGALILAGIAFLQERHGDDHMGAYVANLVRVVQEAAAAGEHPVSPPPSVVPEMPPPRGTAAAVSNPRAGLTLLQRINAMSAFLRNSAPADAQADALASVMAAGLFLRDRYGEPYAVGAIRQVESTVSQMAALDRWQPEGAARN